MEFTAVLFNENSKEMQEIQSWQSHENMQNINKFLLHNNENDDYQETFTNFIANKLNINKNLKIQNVAICYKDIECNNEIAGVAILSAFKVQNITKHNKVCYIEAIFINPDYPAGRGIGRYIVYDIINNSQNYLKNFKPDYFSANVSKNNIASLTMFRHAGFTITEEKTNMHVSRLSNELTNEDERI